MTDPKKPKAEPVPADRVEKGKELDEKDLEQVSGGTAQPPAPLKVKNSG